jgi:hypothetical protein
MRNRGAQITSREWRKASGLFCFGFAPSHNGVWKQWANALHLFANDQMACSPHETASLLQG